MITLIEELVLYPLPKVFLVNETFGNEHVFFLSNKQDYFPIQNLEKIRPRISSV